MKVGYFTERPVRWIPEEVILRNGGHFAVSNSYFDRERAAEDYNYFIDENLYAEELGFDIVALNEHHGNPFCMGSVMNVEAAILARLTKKARILLIGNPLPVIKHPLRMAEELAEIDLISRGRLDLGMGARRGQRAIFQQRESVVQPRILRGGARFYRAGVDQAGAVALRGQAFPLSPRESVGAAVSEAISADVDSGHAQPGDHPLVRAAGASVFRPRHRAAGPLAICGTCMPMRQLKYGYEAGSENFGYLLPTFVAETDEKAQELGQGFFVRRRTEHLLPGRAHAASRLQLERGNSEACEAAAGKLARHQRRKDAWPGRGCRDRSREGSARSSSPGISARRKTSSSLGDRQPEDRHSEDEGDSDHAAARLVDRFQRAGAGQQQGSSDQHASARAGSYCPRSRSMRTRSAWSTRSSASRDRSS